MSTKLIRLDDGILVEVEVAPGESQQVSGGIASRVSQTFDVVQPILVNACRPLVAAWKEINQELSIESAEIELGLSFEAEGNLYVAKSSTGANLTVKLTLKPKS